MPLYAYETQLAISAESADLVVARGSTVTFYDITDTAMSSPLSLFDTSGLPTSNPLTASPEGFIPAFQANVPQLMWSGGGYTGYLNSFQGVLDAAIAASVAADTSSDLATAAATSAADSAADAAAAAAAAQAAAVLSGGGGQAAGDPDIIHAASTSEADVRAAINAAIASKTSGIARKIVQLPPGTITISGNDLIGSPTTGTSDQIFGLTIRGHGERVTTINFTYPGTATTDPRRNNMFTLANRVRNLTFEGIKFTCSNANNNMAWFWSVPTVNASSIYPEYGTGQNQRVVFTRCEWGGTWKRVIGVDGDVNTNNNSEWTWRDCATDTTATFADAFVHSGGISGTFSQQAQYLNWRVDNCNFTLLSGVLFRWDKGGSISVVGGSWSAATNANPITWFYMPNATDQTAMRISIRDVRFEPKADDQLIIDCRWGNGHVIFDNCTDLSSLQNTTSATYALHRYTAVNNRLPLVAYRDCTLAGGHLYTGFAGGRGRAIYDATSFYGLGNGYTKSVGTASGDNDAFLRYSGQKPSFTFRDCDNIDDLIYNA